jgi:predicted Zn-dependent protease
LQAADVVTAFKWLDYILSVEIRQEERQVFLAELHQIGLADPLDSKQYFFPNLLILNSPAGRARLSQFLEKDPQNPYLLLAQGRYKTLEGNFGEAIQLLEQLLAAHPGDGRIGGALLEAYFESDDMDHFQEVMARLPELAESEAWLLTRMRGEGAIARQAYQDAINYFQIVLAHDPANAPAQMGLARAYGALGDKSEQTEALRRAGILAQIRVNLSSVQPDAAAAAKDLAEKCEAIHFDEAAKVFHMHAEAIQQSHPAAASTTPQPKP